jgi:hypothetical protein
VPVQSSAQLRSSKKWLREIPLASTQIVPPVSKILACGDVGNGAMAAVEFIVERTRHVADADAKKRVGALLPPRTALIEMHWECD